MKPERIQRSEIGAPVLKLGRTVATRGALEALRETKQSPMEFLSRHQAGDWGGLCDADRAANETALREDLRVLSSYSTKHGATIWIITEADRSSTCLLLPSEY